MKLVKVTGTILLLGILSFVFWRQKNKLAPSPKTSYKQFKLSLTKAPSQSLKGKIVNHTNEIFYQSRTASQAAELNNFNLVVQQGEDFSTKADSTLILLFPNHVQLDLAENTDLKIIQTLPKTTVFSQLNGEIEYQTLGNYPVSVRTAFLLTELKGNVLITRDSEDSLVTIEVKSGQAKLAYNDLDYSSHTLSLASGESFIFNYDTRQEVSE